MIMIPLEVAASATTGLDLGIPHAALATLGTILFLGLGFIARPQRSTLYWSFAFILTMVASYGYLAAVVSGSEDLRRGSLGLMMGAPVLVWAGLRAHRGVRSYAWVGGIVALASAAALILPGDSPWFATVYRVVFFTSSAFGAAFLWEWRRMPERRERILLPVVILSGLFAVAGLATLLSGLLLPPSTDDQLAANRIFSSVGMLIYMTCIMVSLVPLSTPGARSTSIGATADQWQSFLSTTRTRLDRAEATAERGWSMLQIALDDSDDLEQAGGIAVFHRLVRDIAARVRAIFPADADVGVAPDGAIVVLLARPEAVVRELVRETLRDIAVRDPAAPLTVTPSASIGWATVTTSGYDLDALLAITADAASVARAAGGDRWHRVVGP